MRVAANGGFRIKEGAGDRPDATAWAILALRASKQAPDLISPARANLAAQQWADGRVSISGNHPDAFWPTSLAILAWQNSPEHGEAQARAVRFMLQTPGLHYPRPFDAPFEHDTSIKGWPWIAGTHSWANPTALGLIALKVAGWGGHDAAQEAERMLLNRQLPRGGWNYGNTKVFGAELHPMPESTGIVLDALSQRVPREKIQKSLAFLRTRMDSLRTPRSLGWGLLGLAAWGEALPAAPTMVAHSLERQERYGGYDTVCLALLAVSLLAPQGLESLWR
jgi:hypothetical protein